MQFVFRLCFRSWLLTFITVTKLATFPLPIYAKRMTVVSVWNCVLVSLFLVDGRLTTLSVTIYQALPISSTLVRILDLRGINY